MRSRTALAALTKDVATLRERVATADLGAIPLLETDGSPDAERALADALSQAPDRGYVVRAVVVDLSAGVGDTDTDGSVLDDGPEEDDTTPVLTIVRPPRRVSWDDVYPVPGIRPGRDDVSGRDWYGWDVGRRIYGETVNGERVGLDANGPFVLEPVDG